MIEDEIRSLVRIVTFQAQLLQTYLEPKNFPNVDYYRQYYFYQLKAEVIKANGWDPFEKGSL